MYALHIEAQPLCITAVLHNSPVGIELFNIVIIVYSSCLCNTLNKICETAIDSFRFTNMTSRLIDKRVDKRAYVCCKDEK